MGNSWSSITPLPRPAYWRDFSRHRSMASRDERMPEKVKLQRSSANESIAYTKDQRCFGTNLSLIQARQGQIIMCILHS